MTKQTVISFLNKLATLLFLIMLIAKCAGYFPFSWWIVGSPPLALIVYGFLEGLFKEGR